MIVAGEGDEGLGVCLIKAKKLSGYIYGASEIKGVFWISTGLKGS